MSSIKHKSAFADSCLDRTEQMSSALGQGVECWYKVAPWLNTVEAMARGEVALNAGRRSGQGAVSLGLKQEKT